MLKMTLPAVAFAMIAATCFVGCNGPHRDNVAAPSIVVTPSRKTMQTGESTRVTAKTINLVGTQGIRWAVTPTTGKITPENDNGLSAMFTATEPGTYQITASADAGNGRWVEDYTNITVNGVVIDNRQLNMRNGNPNAPMNTPNNPNYNPNNNPNNNAPAPR